MISQKGVEAGQPHRLPGAHVDGYWNPIQFKHQGTGHSGGEVGWENQDWSLPEALFLASDVQGCRAFTGEVRGRIGNRGCCAGVDLASMETILLEPNRSYVGHVSMVHESMPLLTKSMRTLVRINVPGLSV